MATGTTNPPGSDHPLDLRADAKNLDLLLLAPNDSYPDRLGVPKRSWAGINSAYDSAEANRDALFQAKLANTGYELPSFPYAAGISIVRETQLIERLGEFYRAKAGVVPFVTTGVWATDELNLVAVGDAVLRQELAGPDGAGLSGLRSPLPEALAETVASWIFRFLPDLETFGGKGDYTTLNDVALDKLLASGAKGMRLNQGIYRFSDTVNFPTGFTIMGVGSPTLGHGTFDDKQWLRTGYKDQMPGSSLILSGAPSTSYPCPQRVGEFATLSPCVRIYKGGEGSVGTHWSGFAIIQDMECRVPDGSRFTLPAEDNHAAGYNTGLMIDDVAQLKRTDVVIFGYFSSLGTAISSVSGNDDPDYNQIIGGSTMGRYGLGLLGSNNGPASHGLSGTHAFGHALYSLDHHSRGEMTPSELIAAYADADTWSCLYVDGDVDASSAEINGHEFHACSIRSNANHAIRHDHVSNLKFFGGVYEFRPYGIPNSDTPSFLATANAKRGIEYHSMRNNFGETIFNPNYIDVIPVKVIITGDPLNGRLGVFGRDPAGGYSGIVLGSDGNIGDCAVQWTKNYNDGGSGWRQFMDVSATDTMVTSYNGVVLNSTTSSGIRIPTAGERRDLHEVGAALAIATDAVTVTRSLHSLTPETGNTDDLVTINGGVEGMELILRPTSAAHVITVRRTGNIRLDGSTDKVLSGSLSRMRLIFIGGLWSQLSPIVTNG